MCREKTQQEIQDDFLEACWVAVDYWTDQVRRGEVKPEEAIPGVMHTLLCIVDGVAGWHSMSYEIVPTPSEEEEKVARGEGRNWYPAQDLPSEIVTVHGKSMLHEGMYSGKFTHRRDR